MAAVDLKDRVALVAGGTGLLGIAIARALARAGADVGITYLERRDAARETCAAVEALGRRAFSVALDQTDAGAIPGAIEAAARHFGRLDALVNNAAWNIAIPFPDLESLDAATWDRLFSTNLRGPYLLCRAAAPRLKAGGAGRIVNIASVAGLNPGGSSIAYATSKAGLIHLTRCLAVALAPEVTVNCVAPGLMEGTRMTSRLRPETAEGARQRAALKRAASVEDVADQVVTFCRSDSVTGQVLNIDAGVFFH
ncbi:MAG TPA: SDR family oxidoreductase [Methylomirabilota bacterium]|jgi:NAD(P)-dependent dehydrogenase (short-subunit alcohol dehydrogenase family)|nr:SDR family oxidoreductase [Methylomirabilota bacterium]